MGLVGKAFWEKDVSPETVLNALERVMSKISFVLLTLIISNFNILFLHNKL